MPDETLDCTGLSCPMPIVKLAKTVKPMEAGDSITVTADDPGFEPDIQAWVDAQGHELTSLEEEGGVFTAVIELK
ncbi:MAG: sulfurtransferase TusA family protein [Armatimonadota bacterium]